MSPAYCRARPLRRRAAWWAPPVLGAIVWGLVTFSVGSPADSAMESSHSAPRAISAGPVDAGQLYLQDCASCHGVSGHGSARAPSLAGVGEAAVDFYLSTGRMPKRAYADKVAPYRPVLPEAQIKALDKYVTALVGHGGPPIPHVDVAAGNVAQGAEVYRVYCAGCHQYAGRGGELTDRPVPDLAQATPTQVAEAVRVGPAQMPRFGIQAVSPSQLNSIAAYVLYTHHPLNRGGNDLGLVEPFASGGLTWLVAVPVLLVLLRLIGKRDNSSARK